MCAFNWTTLFTLTFTGLEVLILFNQYNLTQKINKQLFRKEKGYFILDYTDINNYEEKDRKVAEGKYFLDNKLDFLTVGNDDIFLIGYSYTINGIEKQQEVIPYKSFFSKNIMLNRFTAEIDFTNFKKNDKNDVLINLKLKNTNGFQYHELISIQFSKYTNRNYYIVDKYGIEFKE